MLAPFKVLILDDHPLCCEHARSLLMEAGLTDTHMACNAREALEKLGDGGFQLVITDLKMPVLDGVTFVRNLRADESNPFSEVPITVAGPSLMPSPWR